MTSGTIFREKYPQPGNTVNVKVNSVSRCIVKCQIKLKDGNKNSTNHVSFSWFWYCVWALVYLNHWVAGVWLEHLVLRGHDHGLHVEALVYSGSTNKVD